MQIKEWQAYQKKILIPYYRDVIDVQYCECCGSCFGLTFHHLIARSAGGKNDLNNIMLLCMGCHHQAHNATGNKQFQLKLIRLAMLRNNENKEYFLALGYTINYE